MDKKAGRYVRGSLSRPSSPRPTAGNSTGQEVGKRPVRHGTRTEHTGIPVHTTSREEEIEISNISLRPGTRYKRRTFEKVKRDRTTGLMILQLNMNRSKGSIMELNSEEFDIALVQEPNVTKGRVNLIQPPRKSYSIGRSRAAIIINEGTEYWPVDTLSGADLAVISLNTESGIIYFCSAYLDILKEPISNEMNKLVVFCYNEKIPLIIGMDSNAHSVLWGSSENNRRGDRLEEWLLNNELFVHNTGKTPTFAPRREVTNTIIDLTITNRWALDYIYSWKVRTDKDMMTDHRLISYQCDVRHHQEEALMRLYRKANWNLFQEKLEKFQITEGDMTLDDRVWEIMENMKEALDCVAPVRKRKPPSTGSWWTKDLENRRVEIKKRSRRRNKDARALEKLASLKREYVSMIKRAKTQSWKEFTSKASSTKEVSKIIQMSHRKLGCLVCVFRRSHHD